MTYTNSVWGETIDVPGWLSDEASGSLDTLLDLAVLLSELGKSIPCTGMNYAPHLEILNNWKQMGNKASRVHMKSAKDIWFAQSCMVLTDPMSCRKGQCECCCKLAKTVSQYHRREQKASGSTGDPERMTIDELRASNKVGSSRMTGHIILQYES